MTRYVIIGMGISGIGAAVTLRRADPTGEIIFVCDDPFLYYSRPGLAYYLTDEVPEKQLHPFGRQDWKNIGARVVKAHAVSIDPRSHQVQFADAKPLQYERLLLATGATSVPLNVPGEDLKGVVKLDSLDDTRHIIGLARHARSAVVVGGGVLSIEMVEGLLARRVKVHYLLRGDRYWANVLDEAESRIIENRLVHEGVELHCRSEIASILGRNGKVVGVRTKSGETIRCDIVGICIGVKPRLELAKSAGLATDRGILVNEYFQTSEADIFAAGDVAQVHDVKTGRSFVDSLWNPGRVQGATAALNMTGQRCAYERTVDINVLRLANIMVTIIGSVGSGRDEDLVSVARGSSETWQQLPNTIATETGNEINNLRLMVGERTILGGLVMGDQKLSIPLQELVADQTDITPIRERLLASGAPLGEILMDHWTATRGG